MLQYLQSTTIVFALLATTTLAFAGDATRPLARSSQPINQANAAAFTLVSTVEAGSDADVTLSAGTTTPIGSPNTVFCPGSKPCRIEANIYGLMKLGSTSGNRYSLCGTVDGNTMTVPSSGCNVVGTVPADGSYTSANTINLQSNVTPGSHSVSFTAYTDNGATLADWVAVYRVYTKQ